jgi:hypothetical protein
VLVEVIGAEDTYGANARMRNPARSLKIGVLSRKGALEVFAREFAPSATAMSRGNDGLIGGRPGVTPVIRPSVSTRQGRGQDRRAR